MEILQLLLSFFLKDANIDKLKPIIELFSNNSFDLASIIKNLNPEIIKTLMELFPTIENPTTDVVGQEYGLTPIANVGDKEIVYTLNKYFNGQS